jgi:hypothetical protein
MRSARGGLGAVALTVAASVLAPVSANAGQVGVSASAYSDTTQHRYEIDYTWRRGDHSQVTYYVSSDRQTATITDAGSVIVPAPGAPCVLKSEHEAECSATVQAAADTPGDVADYGLQQAWTAAGTCPVPGTGMCDVNGPPPPASGEFTDGFFTLSSNATLAPGDGTAGINLGVQGGSGSNIRIGPAFGIGSEVTVQGGNSVIDTRNGSVAPTDDLVSCGHDGTGTWYRDPDDQGNIFENNGDPNGGCATVIPPT